MSPHLNDPHASRCKWAKRNISLVQCFIIDFNKCMTDKLKSREIMVCLEKSKVFCYVCRNVRETTNWCQFQEKT